MTGAGRKAIYQQLEVAVVAWLDTQLENGLKTHPTVFWDKVSHELTMQALEPTTFEKFVQFGYIHSQHTRLMKLFPMPSDYKNAKKDDVIQTLHATVLAAAKPPPAPEPIAQPKKKQLSIASFFRPNNNPQ